MQETLQVYTPEIIQNYISSRAGETRLGDHIHTVPQNTSWQIALSQTPARYVILGIPEDIGVRANGGTGGAQTGWQPFLKAFLNIQENEFCSGKDIFLLGQIDTAALMEQYGEQEDAEILRQGTAELDAILYPVIREIVSWGKIPILIGGGHNNAYPLLKGLSLGKEQAVNVINMDAHADFRALEGRHSGNGFHYAYAEQYLKHYAAFGLHEAYNNTEIWQHFHQNKDLFYTSFEQIFLRAALDFETALSKNLDHVQNSYYGIELDLDCIADTLSSAASPVGFSRNEALRYLYRAGGHQNAAYLHLTEGVALRADGQAYPMTGKLLSYLAQAFIKGHRDATNPSR